LVHELRISLGKRMGRYGPTLASSGSNSSSEWLPAATISSEAYIDVNWYQRVIGRWCMKQKAERATLTLCSTSDRNANGILLPTESSAMTR
jgi:hypothetical protein